MKGYFRRRGNPGIRNHVLILPASLCASDLCRQAADQVKGAVHYPLQEGCSQIPEDMAMTAKTLSSLAANPNVFGTIVVGLGCENLQASQLAALIQAKTDKPLETVVIQEHGFKGALELVVEKAQELAAAAASQPMVSIDWKDLCIGLECGGSDAFSGIISNPLVGEFSDFIVSYGGTSVFSETTECIGAEDQLLKRMTSEQDRQKFLHCLSAYEKSKKLYGGDIRLQNPSPGNKKGGITTLEEKSLGAVSKSGTAEIVKVASYGDQVFDKGLVFMDTPGNDAVSMAGLAAAGCTLILFTTGRGTPLGHPLVPVIKICASPQTMERCSDMIDVDCSSALKTMDRSELLKKLQEKVERVASGEQTFSEQYGICQTRMVHTDRFLNNGEVEFVYS